MPVLVEYSCGMGEHSQHPLGTQNGLWRDALSVMDEILASCNICHYNMPRPKADVSSPRALWVLAAALCDKAATLREKTLTKVTNDRSTARTSLAARTYTRFRPQIHRMGRGAQAEAAS